MINKIHMKAFTTYEFEGNILDHTNPREKKFLAEIDKICNSIMKIK